MYRKIFIGLFLLTAAAAWSHGTKYEIVKSGKIGIRAMYDTGEVMAEADVLVFPPGSEKAASRIKTDKKGIFHFTPGSPGTWIFQVRDSSGHGMRINLDIDQSLALIEKSPSGSGFNLLQKLVMALCVVWGCTGTALYFKGKKG